MPLKVNELVIQARFDDDEPDISAGSEISGSADFELLREEIIRECMEKVERLLEKRERR